MSSENQKKSLLNPIRIIAKNLLSVRSILFISLVLNANACGRSGYQPARVCKGIQRSISGALEMYQLDTNKMLIVRDKKELAYLVEDKYLDSIPKCPQEGQYNSDRHGNVWCSKHGSYIEKWAGNDPKPAVVSNPPTTFRGFRNIFNLISYLPNSIRILESFISSSFYPNLFSPSSYEGRALMKHLKIFHLLGFLSLIISTGALILYFSLGSLWRKFSVKIIPS